MSPSPDMVPADTTVTRCKSCDAMIFFARTDDFKNMPMDAKPIVMWRVKPLGPGERDHKTAKIRVFQTHFATCPNAGAHRKPRSNP